jgi:CRISPR-associated protein Cas1
VGTLYVDQAGLELRLREGVLQLRRDGRCERTVAASLLERVVLRADTLLSNGTLAALADTGIAVVALGGRGGQRVAHVLGASASDARARVAQCQRVSDTAYAGAWCATLVRAKLAAQRRVLQQALDQRADQRYALTMGLRALERTIEAVRTNRDRDSLRGLEGSGAAAYFGAFSALFAPALAFRARRRRPPPDPVNACLSLGYTLLHGQAVQACWAAGLDPMVGLLHLPSRGRASMACDLVEPWRPRVDAWVWQQFRDRELRAEHFGHDGTGACLLGKAGRANFYAAFTPLQRQLWRGLRRHARLAAAALVQAAELPEHDDREELLA